jgi:hypothetical protein
VTPVTFRVPETLMLPVVFKDAVWRLVPVAFVKVMPWSAETPEEMLREAPWR